MYSHQMNIEPAPKPACTDITKRILVVSAEAEILCAFKNLFAEHGVMIDAYKTCEQALEMLQAGRYAVVIAEIRGLEDRTDADRSFLYAIRENRPDVKIIVLTNNGNDRIRNRALQLGVSFYFEKPVFNLTLLAALRDLRILR